MRHPLFRQPAYPAEYRGRLYMGNIHGNCINVDVLETNGSTYRAEAAPDFLRANDAWFMPVSQKTGPDGCLYILDWYDRYHCYQDANRDPAGIDRQKGRLYRVRYQDTPRRFGFDLARASDDELIELLASANVYDRDTAQRLLAERGSLAIKDKLEALVLDAQIAAPGSNARALGPDRVRPAEASIPRSVVDPPGCVVSRLGRPRGGKYGHGRNGGPRQGARSDWRSQPRSPAPGCNCRPQAGRSSPLAGVARRATSQSSRPADPANRLAESQSARR